MNTNSFLNKENISTMWDVISDEDIFKFMTRDVQTSIFQLFTNNIKGFYEVERQKTNNLIDINKKYILLILNHIKNTYPQKIPNKIKIYDEPPVKESITYEEIQSDRKTQFEKDLQLRQQEFENIMTLKTPPVPEFADNYSDKPITEMDKSIQEIISRRNYDVEQINNNYKSNLNQSSNWLQPQDTSIKMEKLNPLTKKEDKSKNYSKFKYLNLGENADVNQVFKKNVTWAKNNEINEINENNFEINSDDDIESNIFKKLKRVEQKNDENINFTIEEKEHDNRIYLLESEVKKLNTKIDEIIKLLKENK